MGKFRDSAVYLLVIAGCGGLLFDFGGTIIGPAIPYLENLKMFDTAEISHLSSAVVMSAAIACLAAGWLADRFGRKAMMLFPAAVAGLACVPICFCPELESLTGIGAYWWFYVGRAMQGVAAGIIGVVVPMYLAESLDAANRGKGAGVFQLLDFVGISFCSLVGLAVVHVIGSADGDAIGAAQKAVAWKTVFWSSAAPAALFFFGALGLRESPVWLKRRESGVKEETVVAAAPTDGLLQRKYVLPFCISLAVLICNQAIGFNAIQYFSIPMFKAVGLSHEAASAANVAVWLVPLPVTAIACGLVDRAGRKVLLKAGTFGMVVAYVLAAIMFLSLERGWLTGTAAVGWTTVVAIGLFVASFSFGPGVVVWLALSELMPDRIRANGMSICLFVNQMVAFAISDAFLQWVEKSGYATVLFWLAGFAFAYFLVAAFLLPETKGKTLEEIESLWES